MASIQTVEDQLDDQRPESPEQDGLSFVLPHWTAKRHLTGGNPRVAGAHGDAGKEVQTLDWRLKSRLKTHAAALVICLNIAVDPPDIVKTKPCAKLECWVDPGNLRPEKALEEIGKNLQRQFETLSQKVKYKLYLDPAFEDTKKLCHQLRKTAKDERLLFYYNGHGVPAPTASGEIWVFNRNYTQYIPVSLYDLQEWLGSPCIFVWDSSAAGNIINNFNRWAERRDTEAAKAAASNTDPNAPPPPTPMRDCIQLAACGPNETLPMAPELPADLFTSCLTSPIEIALRYFALQDPLKARGAHAPPRPRVTIEMVMRIPGDLKDRRTPLGELNWIFTSVTDTIAWLVFPKDLFRRLFRQDLLVAALFRNFLLAERIMRTYNCTPRSEPALPPTYNHPLWDSWDLTVEACLAQLPKLLQAEESARDPSLPPFIYKYEPSKFYVEHLTALQMWLQNSGVVSRPLSMGDASTPALSLVHQERHPPEQLPIVLQVLLSQAHRLRALILLSKFVDLGSWAVHQALEIGIFPYVQRLLQSPAMELRPVLIFIWSRILAVDRSCQTDLLKDNGFAYFSGILSPYTSTTTVPLLIPNASEHRAMCAFILAVFCRDFKAGQQACLGADVFGSCLIRMKDDDYLLRQWGPLCIAQLWDNNDDAKSIGLQLGAPNLLCEMLRDNSVEVRAAVLYALGTFFGASGSSDPNAKGGGGSGVQLNRTARDQLRTEIGIATSAVLATNGDASPMVRKELIVMLSAIVREWRGWFVAAAWIYWEEERRAANKWDKFGPKGFVVQAITEWSQMPRPEEVESQVEEDQMILSSCNTIYTSLLEMSVDPYVEVATLACTVVDYITALLLDSAFMRAEGSSVRPSQFVPTRQASPNVRSRPLSALATSTQGIDSPTTDASFPFPTVPSLAPALLRTQTSVPVARPNPGGTLKRSDSLAAKMFAFAGYITPAASVEEPTHIPEPLPTTSAFEHAQYLPPYPIDRSYTSDSAGPSISRPSTPGAGSVHSSNYLRPTSSGGRESDEGEGESSSSNLPSCTAAEVIQVLVEEDMERLEIRRRAGSEADSSFYGQRAKASDLGIGLVAREVKDDVLPLKSKFFDWSCEYYTEPQMRQSENDEPGSLKYNEQLWRRERNEHITKEAKTASDIISRDIEGRLGSEPPTKHPWKTQVSSIVNDSWPMKMSFHSFEDHLAISDETDSICIWDWKTRTRLNRFSNGVHAGTTTSMYFINEVSEALLLTASSEGNVRLYRNYDSPGELELASAFRAVTTTVPSSHPSGIITAWDQVAGHLYIAGDLDYVRVWDAHRELSQMDIPTQADACVTTLSVEEDTESTFVAGFGDGSVRLYDKRCSPDQALARTFRKHRTWVQDVTMQLGGHSMVSSSMDGEACIWDFRRTTEPVSEVTFQKKGASAAATHASAPFSASVSNPFVDATRQRFQRLKVHFVGSGHHRVVTELAMPIFTPPGVSLSPKRKFAPWGNALAFHPKETMIAVGGLDSTVKIWRPVFDKWSVVTDDRLGTNGDHA